MVNKLAITAVIAALMFVSVTISIAADKGNARKGKYLFRKNCRSCHIDGGSAKELSPVSKTQADWQKIFDNSGDLECKEEWAKLSEKDTTDIYSYLHGHAFDSPSPAKCK